MASTMAAAAATGAGATDWATLPMFWQPVNVSAAAANASEP